MRYVLDIVVEKIKTHVVCPVTFFRKSYRVCKNVKKFGKARQATNGNIMRRMRFACWIAKATETHSKYVILFYGNSGYAQHCQREGREAGTNYRDAALRKGARAPAVLHMFVSLAVISLFVGCTD
jgi:hypothetical protein